ANGVDFALFIAHHQIGIHLGHFLSHQTELLHALGVKLLLVAERDWFKREDRIARIAHRLDLLLKACRGCCDAKLTASVYNNGCACDCCATDSLNETPCLCGPNPNSVRLARCSPIADVDVVTTNGQIGSGIETQSDIG